MSGYLLNNGTDLANYFESTTPNVVDISSTTLGINIVGTTGPIVFQNNNLTQPINIQTATASGAIQFIANQKTLLSVGATGIIVNSPARSSMLVDLSGAICYTNFNYGYAYINPATSATYTLTASSPRDLFVGGTNSFTLVLPTTPPIGTNFHIIKNNTTGTITLSPGTGVSIYNGTNAPITTTTTPLKLTYYTNNWYGCKF